MEEDQRRSAGRDAGTGMAANVLMDEIELDEDPSKHVRRCVGYVVEVGVKRVWVARGGRTRYT